MKTIAPSVKRAVQTQIDALSNGGSEIITVEELERKLTHASVEGKPLQIKQGIDPTSPDVHLGHMVPFATMRQFQEMGHTGVLIIGDFTAQIGDPTGRTAERRILDREDVQKNAETYTRQIFKIVDKSRTEIRWQTSWFESFDLIRIIGLASEFSVAHLLTHDTFRKRLAPGLRLSLHELFYPMLQAWDSVEVNADVELGGSDQKFNILCGRDLMKTRGLEPQVALLVPLLPGTDGRKMSKSFGNHIPVESSAADMIGKLMSIGDDILPDFMRLAACMQENEVREIQKAMGSGESNPRDVKMKLAKRISCKYHSIEEVEQAAKEFDAVFSDKQFPDDVPTVDTGPEGVGIIDLITDNGLAASTSDARRLIQQGAVSVEGKRVNDIHFRVAPPPGGSLVVKVGKRRFLRVR